MDSLLSLPLEASCSWLCGGLFLAVARLPPLALEYAFVLPVLAYGFVILVLGYGFVTTAVLPALGCGFVLLVLGCGFVLLALGYGFVLLTLGHGVVLLASGCSFVWLASASCCAMCGAGFDFVVGCVSWEITCLFFWDKRKDTTGATENVFLSMFL